MAGSIVLENSKAYPSWQKLRDSDNVLFSAQISFWIFEKSTSFFLRRLFFLTAPPGLSKTPTDMVKTKSNMIFDNLTIKQTYSYLPNTFIGFENLFKCVVNHFIHKDTENSIDIVFGNIFKETRFSPLIFPTKTSTPIYQ